MKKYLMLTMLMSFGLLLSVNAQDCTKKCTKNCPKQSKSKISPSEHAKKVAKFLQLTEQQEKELATYYEKNQEQHKLYKAEKTKEREQKRLEHKQLREQKRAELEKIIGKENMKKMDQQREKCTSKKHSKSGKKSCNKGDKSKGCCADDKAQCDKVSDKKCCSEATNK